MGASTRIVMGALSGVIGAVIWALSIAIYQPSMQPHGYLTDSAGQTMPRLGENNTYWPRDTRELAILLSFIGVILISRATVRGIIIGAVASVAWLSVDIWLDRIDVSGRSTATWLAVAGIAAFVVVAAVAVRVSAGQAGSALARHFTATVAAVLAGTTMLVTTPWDEPITDPGQVRIEVALSVLKAVLVVAFIVAAIGLVLPRLTAVRPARIGAFAAFAAVGVWLAASGNALGIAFLFLAPVIVVAASQDVSGTRLFAAGCLCAVALPPAAVPGYLVGSALGSAMTSLARNPPINGADTDISVAFAGVVVGLLLATVTYLIAVRAAKTDDVQRRAATVGGQ